MKIRSIHLREVGPLTEHDIDLQDNWQGCIEDQVLFSGPNGSGKSSILRAVAHLWNLTGAWLSTPESRAKPSHPSRKWLGRWKTAAFVVDDLQGVGQLGIFCGEPVTLEELQNKYPHAKWIGETKEEREGRGPKPKTVIHDRSEPWIESLSAGYRKVILNGGGNMPNVIHLDGEERRWVEPNRGLGEVVPDDPHLRWLVGYRANEEWKGQLEASLIALKTVEPIHYESVLADLNAFISPKDIDPKPDSNTLRLRVRNIDGGKRGTHSLDDLSAGEHQVLIQIYLISRWLQPGGVVMIDEPDLHLHPSLLSAFLSKLEGLVSEREGQLILTSHNPKLWERYENRGLRIRLGGGQ